MFRTMYCYMSQKRMVLTTKLAEKTLLKLSDSRQENEGEGMYRGRKIGEEGSLLWPVIGHWKISIGT